MGNIYIEVDNDFRVTKIHRMPFDPNNGMGYTREELERKGFFVDSIPTPVNKVGRRSVAMYNPDTKSVYYEYIGIPMSDKERIDYLEGAMDVLLDTIMATRVSMYSRSTVEDMEKQIQKNNKLISTYLAYQIISGKLDLEECLNIYPELNESIKTILKENGIQV